MRSSTGVRTGPAHHAAVAGGGAFAQERPGPGDAEHEWHVQPLSPTSAASAACVPGVSRRRVQCGRPRRLGAREVGGTGRAPGNQLNYLEKEDDRRVAVDAMPLHPPHHGGEGLEKYLPEE